jgi:hypothetical protein
MGRPVGKGIFATEQLSGKRLQLNGGDGRPQPGNYYFIMLTPELKKKLQTCLSLVLIVADHPK